MVHFQLRHVLLVTFFIASFLSLARDCGECVCLCRKPSAKKSDAYGDSLPDGVVARLGTLRFRAPRGIQSIASSIDGKTIATGGSDGVISLWDSSTGNQIRLL